MKTRTWAAALGMTVALFPAGAALGAATGSAVPQCGNADLKAGYRHAPGGDGMNQHWGWIVLRNRSGHRCETGGYGGISYVGHGNGTQIGAAATRVLRARDVWTLEQLREWSEADLAALHGVGPVAVRLLRDALAEHGWTFAP